MRLHARLALTLLLFCAAPALGLTPRLVKDINTFTVPQGSIPGSFVQAGELTYFTAGDREAGRELWRTDGTAAGTFRLLDACPGGCNGTPSFAAREEDRYFFTARYDLYRSSLWVTEGTPVTTFRLTSEDVQLAGYLRWRVWVPEQGLLYFAADDGSHGMELWRSDGTAAGTFQVADMRRGPEGSFPFEMTNFGGRLFFAANDGRGYSLWTSDGTARGTRLVRDPDPRSSNHQSPGQLVAVGRTLFFTAPVPRKGRQIWKSDGTTRGTVPLTQITTQLPDGDPFLDVLALGKRLLFVADTTGNGQELWASDGTAKGTRVLKRYNVPRALLFPSGDRLSRGTIGNRLIFEAQEEGLGQELWATDGTPQGTRIVRDVCPGPCSGAAALEESLTSQGRLFFQGNNGTRGAEPWVTDGTASGTRIVRDLCRGSCGSLAAGFRSGLGQSFFLARNQDGGRELWRTNGTPRGTAKIADLKELEGDNVYFGRFWGSFAGSRFVFNASDDANGTELWASDGTAAGTGLLKDIASATPAGSDVQLLGESAGRLFFFANDGLRGFELWSSDGSEAGTSLVHETLPGEEPGSAGEIGSSTAAGGKMFFVRPDLAFNRVLWRTDGTSAGTLRLTSEGVEVSDPFGRALQAVGTRVFFPAFGGGHGEELWVSDGTVEGTRRLTDLDSNLPGPKELTEYQGRLYFVAETEELGRELWVSDGTAVGTRLVKDIHPGDRSANPLFLTVHAGRLWFSADDGEQGPHLWSTDGTAAGTRRELEGVSDLDGYLSSMTSAGSRLFISANGLWITDGTSAGTRRIKDVSVEFNVKPVIFGGSLIFQGNWYVDSQARSGLWRSDGTEAGTVQIRSEEISSPRDLRVVGDRVLFRTEGGSLMETDGSTVREILDGVIEITPVGGRLFFSRHEPATGTELWVLE